MKHAVKPLKITGRYEHMMQQASSARLPFLQAEERSEAGSRVRVVRPPVESKPDVQEPNQITKVVFGSMAPTVQPALNWLSTPKGQNVLATGAVAAGALALTMLLRD